MILWKWLNMNKIVNKYKELVIDRSDPFCKVCSHHIKYNKRGGEEWKDMKTYENLWKLMNTY